MEKSRKEEPDGGVGLASARGRGRLGLEAERGSGWVPAVGANMGLTW